MGLCETTSETTDGSAASISFFICSWIAAADGGANVLLADRSLIGRGGATVMAMNADGSMKELRKGANNFTCIPDDPTTPGPDPMCFDANAGDWVQAWIDAGRP